MKPGSSIYLSGMPGAGKSTIGKLLAKELNYSFLDTDQWIEQKTGKSIPALFSEGEERFRSIEREALEYATSLAGYVVALGGGSLQTHEIVHKIQSNGMLIFIDVPVSVLLKRLSGDQNRPLLTEGVDSLRDRLETLLAKRLPTYTKAELRFQLTDELTPGQCATMIRNTLLNTALRT